MHYPIADIASILARLLLGLVLLLAGIGKLRADGSVFLKAILAFEIIPRWAARPVSRALPVLEVILGGALVLGIFSGVAAQISFGLITALTVTVVHALAKGRRVFCACFGFSASQVASVQWTMTYRNLVLLIGCVVIEVTQDGWRLDRFLGWDSTATSGLVLTAMSLALMILAVRIAFVRLGSHYHAKPKTVSGNTGELSI